MCLLWMQFHSAKGYKLNFFDLNQIFTNLISTTTYVAAKLAY